MLKDVMSWLDYSFFDEVALVIFAACFVAIVVWALALRRESTHRFSSIPLSDEVVDPRSESNMNSSFNGKPNP
jgi:cbb3-type cytochrome oxidase subunit 3